MDDERRVLAMATRTVVSRPRLVDLTPEQRRRAMALERLGGRAPRHWADLAVFAVAIGALAGIVWWMARLPLVDSPAGPRGEQHEGVQ